MAQYWINLLISMGALDKENQLEAVNKHINHVIRYATDESVWGENDYWASPLEVFSQGQGDCEDIAVLKMFTLLELGWKPETLRLHYVTVTQGSQSLAHMVLGYHEDEYSSPLVLDCMITSIRSLAARRDLTPVYAFNMDNLWVNNELTEHDPKQRMNKWDALIIKIMEEMY
tara:strand:+ start:1557 stop:2072 length:516 start_codon:yes stop_codon:yes gene_type:complete